MPQTPKTVSLQRLDKLIGVPNDTAVQDDYEIEARIGKFRGKKFQSTVGSKDFHRILEYFSTHLNNLYDYVPQVVSLRTEQVINQKVAHWPDVVNEATYNVVQTGKKYPLRIRESFIDIPGIVTPRFYSTKRTIENVDFPNYFTRFSVSKEQDLMTSLDPEVDQSPVPDDLQPQSLRIKARWSFAPDQKSDSPLQPYRIDLTHVTGWYVDRQGKKIDIDTHEIELEVIYKPIKSAQDELWPGVHFMLELVQDTPFPVTAETISDVIQGFNNLFDDDIASLEWAMKKKNPHWFFNRSWRLFNIVNKPINLKTRVLDMSEHLAITDKADGHRYLMYIRPDGAYLLYPPTDVVRYLRVLDADQIMEGQYYIQPEQTDALKNSLFDGELVILEDGTRDYLVFDLLIDRGVNVRHIKFIDRIKKLKELLAKNPITGITVKEFYLPADGNFYTRVNKVLGAIPHKPYGNDGIIFNNINDSYASTVNVYKWKPPNKLTIDFKITQIGPKTFSIYVKEGKGSKLQLFTGTARYPTKSIVEVPSLVINNSTLFSGQIVEMGWDSKAGTFIPDRIRHDRDQPNFFSTAKDVWNDIMDPISENTIRGHDLTSMRRYHNVIKKKMLSHCEKSIIVDIGSGRGGDLHKWKHLGGVQVLAIEPSGEHLQEFHERLLESGYQSVPKSQPSDTYSYVCKDEQGKTEVTLMQGIGQDTEKIVQVYKDVYGHARPTQSVNCITIFNVLTFFFDKEESLDALVNTIDQLLQNDGYFMGLVMDGELVRQMLVKHSLLKETIAKLKRNQYYNLDTKSRINKASAKKMSSRSEKWRLVTEDQDRLIKTVRELQEADPKEVKDHGWTITRTTPFTSSPFGNQIKIHLGDSTIVTEQIEYLIDFDELTRKLADKNIILRDTYFLSNNSSLSASQQKLNRLYRSFTFQRAEPQIIEENLYPVYPLTGNIQKQLKEARQRKKLTESFVKNAQDNLKRAQDESEQLKERIVEMRETKTTITLKRSKELVAERKQLKSDIATAEQKIVKHQSLLVDHEKLIHELEQSLEEFEPSMIKGPTAKRVKKRVGLKKKAVPTPPTPEPVPTPSSPEPVPTPSSPEPVPTPSSPEPPKKVKPKSISGKVIIETETEDDTFVAMDHTIQILKTEEKVPINIKNVDFIRIGTVSGVCVIAAILRAAFKTYIFDQNKVDAQPLTIEQRKKREYKVRKILNTFINTYFRKAYDKGELKILSEYYDTYPKNILKNCQNWQWLDLWEKIAAIFKHNIVVVTVDNPFTAPHIYRTSGGHSKTVVVYNHHGSFDTLSQEDADKNLITVFSNEDITINEL